MNKEQVIKELNKFSGIFLREEDHTYLYNDEDVNFRSVSYLKSKYKKKVPWDVIKNAICKRDNITIDQLEKEWELRRIIGTERGTFVHNYCENRLNGMGVPNAYPDTPNVVSILNPPELLDYSEKLSKMLKAADQYIEYLEGIGATVVAQEVTMYDMASKIAGTFDLLYLDSFGRIHLADFKTDKQFNKQTDNYKGKAKMIGPMKNYYACEEVTYSLQQCLYKNILETYTNLVLPIDHIHIIYLGSKDGNFKDYRCMDLTSEVEVILQEQVDKNFEPQF